MALSAGTKIGSYEILEAIGAGGMGEVYRARDAQLNRDVAIKALPSDVAQDPERLARFRREAQLLAALNHPHIAAIHGLEEVRDELFLVLELVDGNTLDEQNPQSIDECLEIAKQIAEALETAHGKGIIHRDLKPANVKITSEGDVKVLDFGLAKAYEGDGADGSSPELSQSPQSLRLDREMAQLLQEHQSAVRRLAEVPGLGVDSAQQIIAEVGASAATFPSAKHLASWVGVCPGANESAGVNHSRRSPQGNRPMRRILNQAANAAAKTKGSVFQLLYRRLVVRLGHAQAIWAVAHRLCRLIWKIPRQGVDYDERGPEVTRERSQRRIQQMIRDLRKLGYQIEPSAQGGSA